MHLWRTRTEYIITIDTEPACMNSRIAAKYLPQCKTISCVHWLLGNGKATDFNLSSHIMTANHWYNVFMSNLPRFQKVYDSLIDEESRKTFCGFWIGRTSRQYVNFVHACNSQYILDGFIPPVGSTVIDCGVFDGSTSEKFADLGYKVYGFELDDINFKAAEKLAEQKGFVVENMGLGSYEHEISYSRGLFDDNNMLSAISQTNPRGKYKAKITTLDAYVRNKKLPSVDFIKMDVEGAELDIFRGATDTIARFKPILAISAYHKADDFFVLAEFIKKICPHYEFALRHSAVLYEDLKSQTWQAYDAFGLESGQKNDAECVLFARERK